MKSLVIVLLATAASTFATAADAAFNYNGYYLVSFNPPGGPFQHCIELTDTQQYQAQGYTDSGTWLDTDFPNTSGNWAASGREIYIAGLVDGSAYLTIDGKTGAEELRVGAFDYFDPSGNIYAAGTATAVSDSSCASAVVKMPANRRSFLK
jgi:hypothetical protein